MGTLHKFDYDEEDWWEKFEQKKLGIMFVVSTNGKHLFLAPPLGDHGNMVAAARDQLSEDDDLLLSFGRISWSSQGNLLTNFTRGSQPKKPEVTNQLREHIRSWVLSLLS
jgi:hypothetical protein